MRAITDRAPGDTGPAQVVSFFVNVTVTDVDEDGAITLTQLQPEVGTTVTASLTDPDGPSGASLPVTDTAVTDVTWAWEVSEVEQPDVGEDDHWGAATGDGNETTLAMNQHTPADDVGEFLRVTATYTDRQRRQQGSADKVCLPGAG